jgi:pilus assembly protein Flp/PilA
MNKLIVKAQAALNNFKKCDSGASLIEYSLLVGLITVGVVVLVGTVGTWVFEQWTNLNADLAG